MDQGIRLALLIGPTVPVPAPVALMDALVSLEITNQVGGRDGFQMTLAVGKTSQGDYELLDGAVAPQSRVIVTVALGALPEVLFDGIITHHQLAPSNEAGRSRLVVTGEDVSIQLDREDRNEVHRNGTDSSFVETVLANYAGYGITPFVVPTTDARTESPQTSTDYEYVSGLASDNGFEFFLEAGPLPTRSVAYWGPKIRALGGLGLQPALTLGMGSQTNVDAPLSFSFDAISPPVPIVERLDDLTGQPVPIPVPPSLNPPLAARPPQPFRTTILRDVAQLSFEDAVLASLRTTADAADVVTATGNVDALRYGSVLRARRTIGVRGAGRTYDGAYYVRQVTHSLGRGRYTQSFSLAREGTGSQTEVLPV